MNLPFAGLLLDFTAAIPSAEERHAETCSGTEDVSSHGCTATTARNGTAINASQNGQSDSTRGDRRDRGEILPSSVTVDAHCERSASHCILPSQVTHSLPGRIAITADAGAPAGRAGPVTDRQIKHIKLDISHE